MTPITTGGGQNDPSSNASNLVVQPNFPILGRDEVDRGKPRYLTLELNSESGDEKVVFDRKNPQLDLFKQEDKEDSDDEVSFRILSPEKQMMNKSSGIEVPDEETILMLDMMCDIKSSTMVVLGDVKLPEQDAVRHLKEYRDYQDRKKLKNK